MKVASIEQFQIKMLEWYDNSARILPWRDDPTPYRVWISEIMLQQTRVATVKPYFEKFIKEVPRIEDLKNISDDRLLKLWQGLGYYNRAMNLKKTATMVIQDFGGSLPSDIKSLQSLPGIGPYTSGAIASIAFGIKTPAIDGNVLRVVARITANKGDITNRVVKKEIEEIVGEVLPETRVGDFNQSLMELGARTCLPNGRPKCRECPAILICEGYQQGVATLLPVKSKKKPREIEKKTIFVMSFQETIAIRQRPKKGLLSSLWEFPNVEAHLSLKDCEKELKKWKVTSYKIIPLDSSKHIFTHKEWHMIGYLIIIDGKREDSGLQWATREKIEEEYSVPTAFKTYLEYVMNPDDGNLL